jgi:hypothetical protein
VSQRLTLNREEARSKGCETIVFRKDSIVRRLIIRDQDVARATKTLKKIQVTSDYPIRISALIDAVSCVFIPGVIISAFIQAE